MPDSIFHTRTIYSALNALLPGATLRAMLMQAGYVPNPDHDFVSDISANEATGGSYARKTLASVTVAIDDPNNETDIDAADLTQANSNAFSSPTSGQLLVGVQIFRRVGADDSTPADDELVAFCSFGGGDVVSITRGAGAGDDVIQIEGDVTAQFPANTKIRLAGTTDADGTYTVTAAALSGGNTNLTVSEVVAGAQTGAGGVGLKILTADGNNIEYTFAAGGFAKVTHAS